MKEFASSFDVNTSSPACPDASGPLVQRGNATVAAGSWLSRIRSVNIVQQRSNKLQLRAHVPAAPGPQPRRRVVSAAARPSVSAPAPNLGHALCRTGWPPRSGHGSAWGPRRSALTGTGARATELPAGIPGGRAADRWEREAAATWGAPGGAAPPPGPAYPELALRFPRQEPPP